MLSGSLYLFSLPEAILLANLYLSFMSQLKFSLSLSQLKFSLSLSQLKFS